MRIKSGLAAAVVFGISTASAQASLSLYDGTKTGLPATQGSLTFESLYSTATQTLSAGSVGPVTLDTTVGGSNSEYAGYSNFNALGAAVNSSFPVLSPATGFDLTFNLDLQAEAHSTTNRSGFSVILLGSDSYGIELGFWTNQIWAQSTNASNPALDFSHGEGTTNFNPSSGFYSYDLHIQGSNYTLSANGIQILSGATRNYSAYPFPYPITSPYTIPNFVFLGDDSNAAQGVAAIESIGVSVPEPTTALAIVGAGIFSLRRRRVG